MIQQSGSPSFWAYPQSLCSSSKKRVEAATLLCIQSISNPAFEIRFGIASYSTTAKLRKIEYRTPP